MRVNGSTIDQIWLEKGRRGMHMEIGGQVARGRGSKQTKEGRRVWAVAYTQRTEGSGEESKGIIQP